MFCKPLGDCLYLKNAMPIFLLRSSLIILLLFLHFWTQFNQQKRLVTQPVYILVGWQNFRFFVGQQKKLMGFSVQYGDKLVQYTSYLANQNAKKVILYRKLRAHLVRHSTIYSLYSCNWSLDIRPFPIAEATTQN